MTPLPAKSADGSAPRKMPAATTATIAPTIIHRCKRCGKLSSNRVAADDNPMKLMSIAMKPLCSPPFPLDYIEEMTALMGGDGRMR